MCIFISALGNITTMLSLQTSYCRGLRLDEFLSEWTFSRLSHFLATDANQADREPVAKHHGICFREPDEAARRRNIPMSREHHWSLTGTPHLCLLVSLCFLTPFLACKASSLHIMSFSSFRSGVRPWLGIWRMNTIHVPQTDPYKP